MFASKAHAATKLLCFAASPSAITAESAKLKGYEVQGRLPKAAALIGLDAGTHAYILTRYDDTGRPMLDVHATTAKGEGVAMVVDRAIALDHTVLEALQDEMRDQFVRAAYGHDLRTFLEQGGLIRMPSGSTYMDALSWVRPGRDAPAGWVLTPSDEVPPAASEGKPSRARQLHETDERAFMAGVRELSGLADAYDTSVSNAADWNTVDTAIATATELLDNLVQLRRRKRNAVSMERLAARS